MAPGSLHLEIAVVLEKPMAVGTDATVSLHVSHLCGFSALWPSWVFLSKNHKKLCFYHCIGRKTNILICTHTLSFNALKVYSSLFILKELQKFLAAESLVSSGTVPPSVLCRQKRLVTAWKCSDSDWVSRTPTEV